MAQFPLIAPQFFTRTPYVIFSPRGAHLKFPRNYNDIHERKTERKKGKTEKKLTLKLIRSSSASFINCDAVTR